MILQSSAYAVTHYIQYSYNIMSGTRHFSDTIGAERADYSATARTSLWKVLQHASPQLEQ